jgi:hypothetical protein
MGFFIRKKLCPKKLTFFSVADPDPNLEPDPSDPYVFGPPDPDPLVRGLDPDPAPGPDPSITKQK